MKCRRQAWNCLRMIRKVNSIIFHLQLDIKIFIIIGEGSSGSELIAYQPSPYSNSLDLNDLLQNVGNPEMIEQGTSSMPSL